MSSNSLLAIAQRLRSSIERAKLENADIPWLGRFPQKCCNFTANLLVLALTDAELGPVRRMIGTILDEKGDDIANHVWVQAGEFVVDIAADSYDQPSVIVSENSDWHSKLDDIKPFIARIDADSGMNDSEIARLRDLYQETLNILSTF